MYLNLTKKNVNHKKFVITTNALSLCSHDMQVIYVLLGWEGFAHDSGVPRDALSKPNGLQVFKR